MATPSYDKDFYAWSLAQAKLLKTKKFTNLDLNNLIEEIESLGKKDRRALKSFFVVLLLHLLKVKIQKKKTKSWENSIANSRNEIEFILQDSPSLKREIQEFLDEVYQKAKKEASRETKIEIDKFPKECPWTIEQILGEQCTL